MAGNFTIALSYQEKAAHVKLALANRIRIGVMENLRTSHAPPTENARAIRRRARLELSGHQAFDRQGSG